MTIGRRIIYFQKSRCQGDGIGNAEVGRLLDWGYWILDLIRTYFRTSGEISVVFKSEIRNPKSEID